MTAFRHGKLTAVAMGGYDITGYLNEADAAQSFDTAETSHFGSQSKTYIMGEDDGTLQIKGMFESAVSGADTAVHFNDISEGLVALSEAGSDVPWIAAVDAGYTVGRRARMGQGKVSSWEVDSPVSGVVSISGTVQASGGVKGGVMLADGAPITTSTTYAAVDNTVATTTGLFAYVNVANNDGAGTAQVTIQQSVDNSTWTDLIVLTSVAHAVTTGQFGTVIGNVARYLRAKVTLAGTTTVGSVVIVAAARS